LETKQNFFCNKEIKEKLERKKKVVWKFL